MKRRIRVDCSRIGLMSCICTFCSRMWSLQVLYIGSIEVKASRNV
jgi:hypothetical protein